MNWLTSIAGIGGYGWLSVKSWVFRWLNVTREPLPVKLWRFWSELLFFIPLTDVFVTVLGEVTRRMWVAGRAPLGVVARLDEPNVARSYPGHFSLQTCDLCWEREREWNNPPNQLEFEVNKCSRPPRRGKTYTGKWQLVSVLLLIVWKSAARFINQTKAIRAGLFKAGLS